MRKFNIGDIVSSDNGFSYMKICRYSLSQLYYIYYVKYAGYNNYESEYAFHEDDLRLSVINKPKYFLI